MSRGQCALLTILLGFGLAACGGQDTGPAVTAPADDVAAEADAPYASPEPAEPAAPEILVLPGAPEEEDEAE